MFINIFNSDLGNAIQLAKLRVCALTCLGDFCFRSFLSVISVTYRISYN
ncbi:hypothetical protein CIT292_06148 [Citrobacter youngae ATCC 29220]|uniref:Uncharacterized protein n=1 Tax=Citrobacter youngae ATCC 29220 TaxID=500640 RepID=D4B752_9ENTR|nr:hypothetical protein CIT292_06148 [Citrobacter youngae ATCC 29220]